MALPSEWKEANRPMDNLIKWQVLIWFESIWRDRSNGVRLVEFYRETSKLDIVGG